MRFQYQSVKPPRPAVALGGRVTRPRPLVLVSLIGPTGVFARHALLDTGSDDTVFPLVAATGAGIDLSNAPVGTVSGVHGSPAQLLYARATLRLSDGREFREWTAWVGFTSARMRQPLLGYAGCLQFFHANFLGDQEAVELTVNTLYSGS